MAVLTLALGIGATSAIFSVVYSVLMRPLPYAHADRLVQLRERNGAEDRTGMPVTFGNYGTWTREAKSFAALAGQMYGPGLTLTGDGDPLPLRAMHVTASYWRTLSIAPALGRYFDEREGAPGAPHVVVLSHALWRSQYAGDPAVIGRLILLNNMAHTVIGVASPSYDLSAREIETPTVWVPFELGARELAEHADHELAVFGRVREDVPMERALAELRGIEARLAKEYPNSYFDGGIIGTPMRDAIVGPVRPILLVLFGAVGLVLMIACANVSNLLLARAAVRQKEFAIRSALGAGRRRIVGQLLAESVVLALAGGGAGLALAAAGIRALVRLAPRDIPRLPEVGLDAPVLAFTFVVAVLCGIVFGLVPALRASRADVRDALSQGGRDTGGSVRYGVRASLVVGQLAIALPLLVGAGLLLRSAIRLQQVVPGFATRNVLIGSVSLPAARFPSDTIARQTFERFLETVTRLPGVEAAGLASQVPIANMGSDCPIVRPEGSLPKDARITDANNRIATPGFFAALKVPLLRGRLLSDADRAGALPVVVINRGLAQRLFGDADAVGRRLAACDAGSAGSPVWYTVVGVIGDVRANGLMADPPSEVYFPFAQSPQRRMTLVVRSAAAPAALVPAIRRSLRAVDPSLPLGNVSTMDDVVSRSVAVPKFTTMLLAMLGGAGLILAVVGIYGVIAYFVSQRTRELGVRIALGASPSSVVTLVVRQGMTLALSGVLAGLVLSWWLTKILGSVLEQMLFQVSAHDPLVFTGIAALLVAVALIASAIPAWRAARVHPGVALRMS